MNHLFRALDDPTRRRILDLLGQRDHSAGEIAAAFSLGKPTVSHHLGLLRRAGLVSSRKLGQSVHYRLEATVLDECLTWFMNLIQRGQDHTAARSDHHEKHRQITPPRMAPTLPLAAPIRGGSGLVE